MVLSHHHGDHFDRVAARALDHDLPVITEPHAARKLRKQGFRSPVPLSTWQSRVITHADGDAEVRVTSLPGQHALDAGLRRAAGDGQPAGLLPGWETAADQAGLPTVIHYLNRGDSYRLGRSEQ